MHTVTVLVADDSFSNRQLTADVLSTLGYRIIMAVNGTEALALTQQLLPDMIVLDVNMPGMDGFEVCERLKRDSATAQIPILMLTAINDVENRVRGLVLGADDYLTKPFNPRELVERVRTRVRAKLETDSLRETQQLIRRTFERFVPPAVVEKLLQDPSMVKLGGQLQTVTVLFTDLENFTSISEATEPELLLAVLNQYHTLVVEHIRQFDGTVDKLMGDSVMALFNTPLPQNDHAERAVRTALAIQESLARFHLQFDIAYRMPINVGIHTGTAVVGNVGTPDVMDFTAVGDTVNLAARLQQTARNGQILISEATYQLVHSFVVADVIGSLNVKGRTRAVTTYQVMELATPVPSELSP